NVEIPVLKSKNKVKSIQVFRKPVDKAIQGDRCGICLANFDSKQFERGFVCSPGYVKTAYAVIIELNKIKHFKSKIESRSKFHISIGHETVLAKVELFSAQKEFSFESEFLHIPEVDQEYLDQSPKDTKVYALIDFGCESTSEHGVLCVEKSLLIGSKLDTDIHLNQCRIAFYGRVLHSFGSKDFRENELLALKVYKEKSKEGVVERKHDEFTVIGKALFKKETNIDIFVGLRVQLSTGDEGVIESGFGQSGKFKVRIANGLSQKLRDCLDKKGAVQPQYGPVKIILNFKRFVYDDKKKMTQ
ncbi:selenocysteine-specific elongation factor, partial [Brachionus plicatilis]